MKAVFFEKHGGNEVLLYGDRPTPEPGPGEVRIAVRAAALNRLDLFVRNGIPNVPLPQIPGADASGVVDRLGEGVGGLTPGDRVLVQPGLYCADCESCRGGEQSLCATFRIVGEQVAGTFAEYAVVPARNLFAIPAGLSFVEAAAFPLVYQTAWRMVVGRAAVRPGETVLIHGAGGGAAGAALEIARLRRRARPRDDLGRGEGRAPGRRRAPSSSSTTRREDVASGRPAPYRQARRRRRRRHGRRGHLDDLAQVRRRRAGASSPAARPRGRTRRRRSA